MSPRFLLAKSRGADSYLSVRTPFEEEKGRKITPRAETSFRGSLNYSDLWSLQGHHHREVGPQSISEH